MAASDILFQDRDVCILKPDSDRGILIYTISRPRFGGNTKTVCQEGLLSYNELLKRHPEYKLKPRLGLYINSNHNDLIFFRAPFTSDVNSFESSYNGESPKDMLSKYSPETIVTIRIDPDLTWVYSSEIRVMGSYSNLLRSRIPMRAYLEKLKTMPKEYLKNGKNMYANIITYEKVFKNSKNVPVSRSIFNNWGLSNNNWNPNNDYGYNNEEENYENYEENEYNNDNKGNRGGAYPLVKHFPIERNAEVVVKIPHIPPEWFVSCDSNNIAKGGHNKCRTLKKHKKRRTYKRSIKKAHKRL